MHTCFTFCFELLHHLPVPAHEGCRDSKAFCHGTKHHNVPRFESRPLQRAATTLSVGRVRMGITAKNPERLRIIHEQCATKPKCTFQILPKRSHIAASWTYTVSDY